MVGFYTVPAPPPPLSLLFSMLSLSIIPSLPPSFSNSLPFFQLILLFLVLVFGFSVVFLLCVCVCVLSSVVSLIESFLSILALLVITTWSSTLCLVFRLFFLVLFVSQGGFTAESLIVVFQLVELALYPYSVCVCSVFRVLSYSPLFLLSQYFLPSLCNLSFVPPCFVFSEGDSCDRVLTCATPPPPPSHIHPLPSFSPAFPFFPLPLFLTSFFFQLILLLLVMGFVGVCVFCLPCFFIELFPSILAVLLFAIWSMFSEGGFTAESLTVLFQLV